MDTLKDHLTIRFEAFPEGRISANARKQREYLTVSLVNTFMIAAIQGGAYPPEANWIADRALVRLASLHDLSGIPELVSDAALQLCELVDRTRRETTLDAHVKKAKHYIVAHITKDVRVQDIAQEVGLNPSYLCRLFKARTGQTMRAFLIQERIVIARKLLADDEYTIPQIATHLRFCDQSYFTKVFREHTGMTSKRYRDAHLV